MFREKSREFGTVLKTHGVKGELLIKTDFQIPERFKIPGSIFFEIEGLLVPFFIEELNILDDYIIQVKIFDLNDKTKAQRFLEHKVFIEDFVFNSSKIKEPATVIGFDLADQEGELVGKITGMMDIPGNFLLTVGEGKDELLIPFNEHVLIDIDKKKKLVKVNIPPGLTELNK